MSGSLSYRAHCGRPDRREQLHLWFRLVVMVCLIKPCHFEKLAHMLRSEVRFTLSFQVTVTRNEVCETKDQLCLALIPLSRVVLPMIFINHNMYQHVHVHYLWYSTVHTHVTFSKQMMPKGQVAKHKASDYYTVLVFCHLCVLDAAAR